MTIIYYYMLHKDKLYKGNSTTRIIFSINNHETTLLTIDYQNDSRLNSIVKLLDITNSRHVYNKTLQTWYLY